ncbi:peptidyl-prolyl cis-trans isomerase CYP38, chloroplastic-like isoform X2 [Macadamia integrifolia]|uniref:peptidyl-prolyl cis-trans isomerase CYP38, chloroplastic-like isoform X2 n=1 Tax=Macadamia integrifolia TaxID=60698 RepID=UPI001C4E3035|nr:peptidyl-prolyl cis-trans isomerase CYP38, chloroplastic-like isoform X2 [Macadamia integrifolia]
MSCAPLQVSRCPSLQSLKPYRSLTGSFFSFCTVISMEAFLSCHYFPSIATSRRFFPSISTTRGTCLSDNQRSLWIRRFGPKCSSGKPSGFLPDHEQKGRSFSLKECAFSIALAIGLVTGVPALAYPANPVLPDVSVLISGPPIKDPGALLRYALPIDNKAIREVQKPLEDITDSLKLSGARALDSIERNVKQASRALKQGKDMILSGVAESKKEHGKELLDKLEVGMEELQQIVEEQKRDDVAPKQKELLQYVGGVEEDMVDGFPYEVPEEYRNMPLLKGRATVDMKVKVKDNPNLDECVFHIVLDGYNAPVTAGNFIDLVERHFYDGMEIQRADGFVVQTGDPEGPAEGFIDPSTEKPRTIPLEIMVDGDKTPVYGETLEELGRYKAQTKLPFNAFGTMAMARDEFEDNSASSQVFWLLKESELTPSNANILDGRYAVFGYVTDNEDYLADLKVGDVIQSIQVVSGLDNLVNPTYKIAA